MAEARTTDVVVLGAGPAGENCAGRAADHGLDVILIESELVGGECSFWACMPSKALLRPGDLVEEVDRVPGVLTPSGDRLDATAVLERRTEVVHDYDDSAQLPWLEDHGVELIRGQGRLEGERTVRVGDTVIEARKAVVVATGSSALLPPIPGLVEARPWTNREVTEAKAIPGRLLILGGGVVGVEMAQAYASLGASVAMIEAGPRVLAREEEFAGEQVAGALSAAGVEIHTNVKADAVRRGESQVEVDLTDGTTLRGDELLVAIGRHPRTDDIGMHTVGLEPGESIEVDDHLRSTAHDWLFAIGDVNERALLTHSGKYQARAAADVIAGRDASATADKAMSPRVVFTDPQVAAVGHTLASAQEAGLDVRAVDTETGGVAGASFYGRGAPGTSRIVVDEKRRVIVGATFTGPDIAELLHSASIAVVAEVPLDTLWHAIPSFPTRSEVWLRLLEKYGL